MIKTYLAQLKEAAAAAGVDLRDACRQEGIADTTLARWENGDSSPREQTAKKLFSRMRKMGRAVA